MKKLPLIAIASLCAVVAVAWSVPASAMTDAVYLAKNKKPEHYGWYKREKGDNDDPTSSVPEPGTLALLALGLGGLGVAPLRRRRKD